MISLGGYADKTHPFLFERNFLDAVSVLFCFLFVIQERMIHGKTKNLFSPFKGKLNTSTSVTGKESPKRLIFAQRNHLRIKENCTERRMTVNGEWSVPDGLFGGISPD